MMLLNTPFLRVALATALILSLPLLAMQFSTDVSWSPFDFVLAGTLLLGTGLVFEVLLKKGVSRSYRLAFGLALVTALFLLWSNLALGILGSEANPANVLYVGVLAIGVIGAIIARFQARGMVRTLVATAAAQVLVPVIAVLTGKFQLSSPAALGEVAGITALFVALWLGSALLFRKADNDGHSQLASHPNQAR